MDSTFNLILQIFMAICWSFGCPFVLCWFQWLTPFIIHDDSIELSAIFRATKTLNNSCCFLYPFDWIIANIRYNVTELHHKCIKI